MAVENAEDFESLHEVVSDSVIYSEGFVLYEQEEALERWPNLPSRGELAEELGERFDQLV